MDNYDFDRIGKKMPYRVPDTFFADVENKIIAQTCSRRDSRRNVFRIIYRSIAVAATLALFFIVGNPGMTSKKTDFAEIAQAFDNLSDADQSYLLEMYQDDIFINE